MLQFRMISHTHAYRVVIKHLRGEKKLTTQEKDFKECFTVNTERPKDGKEKNPFATKNLEDDWCFCLLFRLLLSSRLICLSRQTHQQLFFFGWSSIKHITQTHTQRAPMGRSEKSEKFHWKRKSIKIINYLAPFSRELLNNRQKSVLDKHFYRSARAYLARFFSHIHHRCLHKKELIDLCVFAMLTNEWAETTKNRINRKRAEIKFFLRLD